MSSRPAFLQRFTSRLPDPRTLRFRVVGGFGLVAGAFAALLVFALAQLDARRCAEVACQRATTLAHTAGAWLDGDAHAGLGQAPDKRLSDLTATLEKLIDASDFPCVVRTLRPKAASKAALAAQPEVQRSGALEVVIQTGTNAVRKDVDYRLEMRDALFEGKAVNVVANGRVAAYAPVPDSWGSSPAIVWVDAPASAPLWRLILFPAACALLAGLLVTLVIWSARRVADRLELHVATLASGARQLALGQLPGPIELGNDAPRELVELAGALDDLRARMEAQATGQPLPALPASVEEELQRAVLGEASEFDPALLLQQLVEPLQKTAQTRRIDLQLVLPDAMPAQLVGHPMPLFRALDSLLRNALRATRQGRITLRVSRVAEGPEGGKLRFEVSDTSPGIAFKEQQDLQSSLAEAAHADPSTLRDPLQLASALAAALGGELTFESQPGQGSRFGFTAAFQGFTPSPPTAFRQHPATAFQPQPALPASAFQPRQPMRTR